MLLLKAKTLRAVRPGISRRHGVRNVVMFLAAFCLVQLAGAQALQPGGPTDMGSVAVGSSSLNYTFTFSAAATTTITSVTTEEEGAANQDFVLDSQDCTGTISPPYSCNVTVTFTPKKIGLRRGAIVVVDNTGATVLEQFVYGVGQGPQLVFSPMSSTVVSSLAGLSPSTFQSSSAVYDGAGNLYFNDFLNGRLLERNTAGTITSLGNFAGNANSSLAIDGAGTLFLTMPTQGNVEEIRPGGTNSVLATPGLTLTSPSGIAVDGAGFIYIADSQANRILLVSTDGSAAKVLPITGLSTPLSSPYGLAIDHNNLYIADSGNGRIVEVNLATDVATAMTSTGALNNPYGIAVDAAGDVLVANAGGSNLEQVSATGVVSPLVADYGQTISAAPLGVTVTSTGDIVASDKTLGLVFITRSQGELTFPTGTKQGSFDATDGYEALTVQNSGNVGVNFALTTPTISSSDFAAGTTHTCSISQSPTTLLTAGASCTYTFGFTPSLVGTEDATVSVQGTGVGTGYSVAAQATSIGTGISPVDVLKVVATPSSTAPGAPVSFTVTAYDGTTVLTSFSGTVTFTMTDSTGLFLSGTSYTFKASDDGTHTFPAALGAEFNASGVYTITATYGSLTGTSNTVTVLYPSQTTLTSSVNPVGIDMPTTLAATVAGVGTGLTATGTITFYDGSTAIGSCPLVGGKCSYVATLTLGGEQSLTAVYSGDSNLATSTSNTVNEMVNGYIVQIGLTSSVNPSFIAQKTTLTATVTVPSGQTGAGTPTGTITFYDNATKLGTATISGGKASISVGFSTVGTHPLIAVYSGDPSFVSTASAQYSQQVIDYAETTTIVSSTFNPSYLDESTTFTVTATATAGQADAPVPTGTVAIYDGTTDLGSLTLSGGAGTATFSFSTLGTHSMTAHYSGDGNYAANVSAVYSQIVVSYQAKDTLMSSVNPSTVNQQTLLTATIAPAVNGNPTATGKVTFYDGSTVIGTGTLVNGAASLQTSFTNPGTHLLTVVYAGDSNYGAATSAQVSQTVIGYTAVATVTTATNPSTVGQSVTVSGTLRPTTGQTNAPAPTGTVTYFDGTTKLGSATITGNYAGSIPVTFTTAGNHDLTLAYSGDANYAAVTSAVYVQVVDSLFTSQVALTSSVNPVAVNGQTTLAVTVSAAAGQTGAGTPSGKVTFYDGTTVLGSATLANGAASLAVSFTATGSHAITAVYAGDTSFNGATSNTVTETVNALTPQVGLTSSVDPSLVNQQTTLTATVAPPTGSKTTPTGSVIFKNGTATLGTVALVNGVAALPVSFPATGSYSLTAVYSGDTIYGGLTSAAVTQTVNNFTASVSLGGVSGVAFINNTVTFTATVAPGPGGTVAPSGTVTFMSGTTPLGSAALVNGVAALPTYFSATSTYSITAVYSGDTNYETGTSPSQTETIEDFALTLASPIGGTVTVMGGQPASYTFTVSAVGGTTMAGPIAFALAGFPTGTVYTFSPTTLASGAGTTTVTLTVTPPVATAMNRNAPIHPRNAGRYAPVVFAFLMLPFALPWGRKRGRRPAALLLWAMLFASTLGLTGCLSDSQSGYYGTNPETYSLNITASSGTLSHATVVTLVRQ
jgi:sugar lactone lactonase YvrE